jgi:hypothetical protein
MNNLRGNLGWWAVKIAVALYQIPATWDVFYNILYDAGRRSYLLYMETILAIVLIDLLLLASLHLLETPASNPVIKLPLALVVTLLTIAIFGIGIADEGVLGFAPRMGLVGLVLTDVLNWLFEVYRYNNDRERIEQRIHNNSVVHRRKALAKAKHQAIEQSEPILIRLQTQRLLDELNLLGIYQATAYSDHEIDRLANIGLEVIDPAANNARQIMHAVQDDAWQYYDDVTDPDDESDQPVYDLLQIESGIYQLESGNYAWQHPETGRLEETTSQGNPYTLVGAKRARSRALKGG